MNGIALIRAAFEARVGKLESEAKYNALSDMLTERARHKPGGHVNPIPSSISVHSSTPPSSPLPSSTHWPPANDWLHEYSPVISNRSQRLYMASHYNKLHFNILHLLCFL